MSFENCLARCRLDLVAAPKSPRPIPNHGLAYRLPPLGLRIVFTDRRRARRRLGLPRPRSGARRRSGVPCRRYRHAVCAQSLPPRRVLTLTGAGASASLGADGTSLPMMSSWATRLVSALGHRAQQIGLTADMPGDEFEVALGRFLAFEAALPIVHPFTHINQPAHQALGKDMGIESWFQQAFAATSEIRRGIWRNLFESFGLERVDPGAAIDSYARLHALIRAADGDGAESYLAHATTNYDPAIEVAVQNTKGVRLVDGFVSQAGGGRQTYAPNLLADQWQTTDQVPVLHIHGAVGWYFQNDGTITRRPTDDEYDERQTPALLLPDNTKNPDLFTAPIRETWLSLNRLLQQASHVLFVGHSLHDPHIVAAVRAADRPTAVVAYAPPDAHGIYPEPPRDERDRISSLLPDATVLPGAFGQRAEWPDLDAQRLERWLLSTSPAIS
jgi:hypothetical protein